MLQHLPLYRSGGLDDVVFEQPFAKLRGAEVFRINDAVELPRQPEILAINRLVDHGGPDDPVRMYRSQRLGEDLCPGQITEGETGETMNLHGDHDFPPGL